MFTVKDDALPEAVKQLDNSAAQKKTLNKVIQDLYSFTVGLVTNTAPEEPISIPEVATRLSNLLERDITITHLNELDYILTDINAAAQYHFKIVAPIEYMLNSFPRFKHDNLKDDIKVLLNTPLFNAFLRRLRSYHERYTSRMPEDEESQTLINAQLTAELNQLNLLLAQIMGRDLMSITPRSRNDIGVIIADDIEGEQIFFRYTVMCNETKKAYEHCQSFLNNLVIRVDFQEEHVYEANGRRVQFDDFDDRKMFVLGEVLNAPTIHDVMQRLHESGAAKDMIARRSLKLTREVAKFLKQLYDKKLIYTDSKGTNYADISDEIRDAIIAFDPKAMFTTIGVKLDDEHTVELMYISAMTTPDYIPDDFNTTKRSTYPLDKLYCYQLGKILLESLLGRFIPKTDLPEALDSLTKTYGKAIAKLCQRLLNGEMRLLDMALAKLNQAIDKSQPKTSPSSASPARARVSAGSGTLARLPGFGSRLGSSPHVSSPRTVIQNPLLSALKDQQAERAAQKFQTKGDRTSELIAGRSRSEGASANTPMVSNPIFGNSTLRSILMRRNPLMFADSLTTLRALSTASSSLPGNDLSSSSDDSSSEHKSGAKHDFGT